MKGFIDMSGPFETSPSKIPSEYVLQSPNSVSILARQFAT